ncbi:MAG: hypothetical protein KC503_39825 [Myxococcales bacterium]|nr:hypothetical protein [Myxococcales bacterium]
MFHRLAHRVHQQLIVIVLATLALVVVPAAPPACAAAKVGQAKRLFEKATQALQAGRLAEARDLLRRSLALHAHPATAFNLAVALRGTGEVTAAMTVLENLLAGRYGKLPASRRAEALRYREVTAKEVGKLDVHVRGAPKAAISIDGAPRATVTGRAQLHVDPGSHRVSASAEGMKPAQQTVQVGRGALATVRFALEPQVQRGTLIVEAASPQTSLEIVGVGRAMGRLRRELPPGRYTVRARGAHGERSRDVEVSAGRWTTVQMSAPGRSIFRSPWFWVIAGAVAAASVTTALVLATRGGSEPITDPVFPVTYTLRPAR